MHKHAGALPLVGNSRWKQIEPFVGVSRETWRKLCLARWALRPMRPSFRRIVWHNEQIHEYLSAHPHTVVNKLPMRCGHCLAAGRIFR